MSYSRVFYEPYEVGTGKAIAPVTEYEDAVTAALVEEAYRLQTVGDEGFPTPEACAAAVDAARCAVRFVRATALEGLDVSRRGSGRP